MKLPILVILTVFLLQPAFTALRKTAIHPQEQVHITEFGPNILLLSTSKGNAIASVGPDGALLVGELPANATAAVNRLLASRTQSPMRYVIIEPQDASHSEGDAGWVRLGAFVAMHENALRRIGGNKMEGMDSPSSAELPDQFVKLGVERPRVAFSEVLAFDLNQEAIHIVHQKPGYSDADAIVHFHAANLVYLGEVFPGDGYPKIDFSQGGTLEGLLTTLGSWTGNTIRVVPARGQITDGSTVEAFRDMILAVRDRVQRLVDQGRTENQVVDAHPTTEFDKRWGNGRIGPDTFVREVYRSVKESRRK